MRSFVALLSLTTLALLLSLPASAGNYFTVGIGRGTLTTDHTFEDSTTHMESTQNDTFDIKLGNLEGKLAVYFTAKGVLLPGGEPMNGSASFGGLSPYVFSTDHRYEFEDERPTGGVGATYWLEDTAHGPFISGGIGNVSWNPSDCEREVGHGVSLGIGYQITSRFSVEYSTFNGKAHNYYEDTSTTLRARMLTVNVRFASH
jgi:hypothetical protein